MLFCPYCSHKLGGKAVPGETVCSGCGKLLSPPLAPRVELLPATEGKKSAGLGGLAAGGLGCLGAVVFILVGAMIAFFILLSFLSNLFGSCKA